MIGLSENTNERLNALRINYLQNLPVRYNQLKQSAAMVIEQRKNVKTLTTLKMNVHKIAGSAATFGLTDLTDMAKNLETLTDEIIENGHPVSDEESKKIIKSLKEIRKELG